MCVCVCLCDSGQHPLRRSVGTANERREEEEEEEGEEEDAVPTNGSETVQDASVVTTCTAGLVGGPGPLHFLSFLPSSWSAVPTPPRHTIVSLLEWNEMDIVGWILLV